MARVFLTSDEAQALIAKFPKTAKEKLDLLAYELREVPTEQLAPVVAALERAIPVFTWNSQHALDARLSTEHAVEEGRASIVEAMNLELEARKNVK